MSRATTRSVDAAAEVNRSSCRATLLLVAVPLLLAIVIAASQGPVQPLGDDWIFFSHFDHVPLLPHGTTGTDCAILTNAAEEHGLRFRPFAYAHMWLERRVSGSFALNWWIGIGYLGLAGSFLALLLRSLGLALLPAAAAGLLLVGHPAGAEVYGWASARIDTMAAAFGLAALWLVVRRRPVFAGLAFVAAFLSKESAYPLVLLPPLLLLAERKSPRLAALAAIPGLAALGLAAAAKVALVGGFFATTWAGGLAGIPLGLRLSGYLSYLGPLALRPASTLAHGNATELLAVGFTVLLVGSVAARLVSTGRSTNERPDPRLPIALAIGFALSLAVTFGVPVVGNLTGGRLWFLPAAFLVGLLASTGSAAFLGIALVPGVLLLHQNLAPYREANRRMAVVVERLAREVSDPTPAVRVRDLEALHGPVPLFFLMTEHYHETLPGPPARYARVLLTRDDQQQRDPAGLLDLDRRWRALMHDEGRRIVDLRWDAASGRLLECAPPDR